MENLKCLILDDYQNVAFKTADWSKLNHRVTISSLQYHFENQDQLVSQLANADILVVMRERTPLSKEILIQLPKLKLIITSGMRNASIDMQAAALQNIVVCGTSSSSEPPTELTWALLLNLARQIRVENENLRNGKHWQSTVGFDLHGKQLGILGLGKIGNKVAKIAKAFGMNISAWSQNLKKETTDALGVTLAASKEELLRTSDFLSIHLILSERTRNLIGTDELRLMKPNAFLINTSRGAIINEEALIEALNEKWIAGAGLDVFEVEPLPPQHPFRKLDNLLATPHLGYVSQTNYNVYFGEAIEDIDAFLNGNPIRTLN